MLETSPSMVTLRLFRQDAPFRQLEARSFDGGQLSIGRDPSADWAIEDPDLTVSRLHCSVAMRDGVLTLTDTSSNGVLIGAARSPAPAGEPVALAPGESFRLGKFMILIDADNIEAGAAAEARPRHAGPSLEATTLAFEGPFAGPMLKDHEVTPADLAVPRAWAEDAPRSSEPAPVGDTAAAMLDAFCAGAGLEASAFASEDPAVLMGRLGEVYRQMVLGLSDQMNARAGLKSELRMDRTTVGAADNNPFKWAPAHRVAVDLLRRRDDGFLSGPEAAEASFEDMKKHVLCLLAGLRAAIASTLNALEPEAIEARTAGGRFLLASAREAAAWREYLKIHEALTLDAAESRDSAVNRAFRAAYDQRLQELDGMRPRG